MLLPRLLSYVCCFASPTSAPLVKRTALARSRSGRQILFLFLPNFHSPSFPCLFSLVVLFPCHPPPSLPLSLSLSLPLPLPLFSLPLSPSLSVPPSLVSSLHTERSLAIAHFVI